MKVLQYLQTEVSFSVTSLLLPSTASLSDAKTDTTVMNHMHQTDTSDWVWQEQEILLVSSYMCASQWSVAA